MAVVFKKSETLKVLMHIFADLQENNKLFIFDIKCQWMCLNCGHVIEATQAPAKCPVCDHDRGYFIRLEFSPYTGCDA